MVIQADEMDSLGWCAASEPSITISTVAVSAGAGVPLKIFHVVGITGILVISPASGFYYFTRKPACWCGRQSMQHCGPACAAPEPAVRAGAKRHMVCGEGSAPIRVRTAALRHLSFHIFSTGSELRIRWHFLVPLRQRRRKSGPPNNPPDLNKKQSETKYLILSGY